VNLCEQLESLFGRRMRGELTLAIAAAAQAFLENLEEFRGVVELVVRSEMEEIEWEQLFALREVIVSNVIAFAPPTGPGGH
jgi:hypothetical protein